MRYHTTSGTTGRTPLRVLDGTKDWEWIAEMWCYGLWAFGLRPSDIVLGDRFGVSCHHGLIGCALRHLDARGLPAAQNRPYSGGYVLDRHGAPQRGVHAVQVEVCRAAYLDHRLAEPGEGLAAMGAALAELVRVMGAETAVLGGGESLRQAAE